MVGVGPETAVSGSFADDAQAPTTAIGRMRQMQRRPERWYQAERLIRYVP
jgi:hypothetical protein